MMSNIVSGTIYQFDLEDLAMIGRNNEGIVFHYKQGKSILVKVDEDEDRERQYQEVCAVHIKYNKEKRWQQLSEKET